MEGERRERRRRRRIIERKGRRGTGLFPDYSKGGCPHQGSSPPAPRRRHHRRHVVRFALSEAKTRDRKPWAKKIESVPPV